MTDYRREARRLLDVVGPIADGDPAKSQVLAKAQVLATLAATPEPTEPPLIEQAIERARAGKGWMADIHIDIPDRFACNLELCVARGELLADLEARLDLPPDLVERYNALNDAIHHGDEHLGRKS